MIQKKCKTCGAMFWTQRPKNGVEHCWRHEPLELPAIDRVGDIARGRNMTREYDYNREDEGVRDGEYR